MFRDKLKKVGFRVLMSTDATNALKRYQQSPYHALLIDAGTVGKDGVDTFRKVLRESDSMRLDLSGVLVVNEDQADWAEQVKGFEHASAFVRPVGMKQIVQHFRATIEELATSEK